MTAKTDFLPDGSSPLTRGAPRWHGPSTRSLPAHPRSRGEHAVLGATGTGADGSSPLTRGAPAARHTLDEPGRLIPAHAGSTAQKSASDGGSAAHPRSRGEHESSAARTWSTYWLIPAHAGSTLNDLRF